MQPANVGPPSHLPSGHSAVGGPAAPPSAPPSSNDSADGGGNNSISKGLFLEKVRQSNAACQAGNFELAIQLYSEAISLEPSNHILYSNRSAAYIKLGQYFKSLQDANTARDLKPDWPKSYYRQGVALQCLGRYAEALASFSSGLAIEPKSTQLLNGLVDSAMKSPFKDTLTSTFQQLQAMQLDKNSFVIISVIGQELLAGGKYPSAVTVLEAALKIGTSFRKLRGSVFSALSSAYWALSCLDKAIYYMQQDLSVAKYHEDIAGECRAHGNLGSAYFSKGNFKEALTSHRYQLVLALKCRDTHAAASALTSLGHVYSAVGDYPNALASHKQCVQIVKQMNDKLLEAREIGNVGAVYLAMGNFDTAVDCHMEHLRIAKQLSNKVEEARAYSNLGSSHHYKRNFDQAVGFHNQVLRIAQELRDRNIEARAYAGLGHAARCMADYSQAQKWHEKQLDMALSAKDKIAEGRACSNLGIVYQLMGYHDAALKLHQSHLNITRVLQDRAGMGRAYGNIGNAYSAMGFYEQAINYHKQELTISKEVNDRISEASTHGNLAVSYQALNMHEMALRHYQSHLNIAKELKDSPGEACALLNLGNCHSSKGQFSQAIPYYEQYLMLSQELHDSEGEAKACHFLGYAHFCLANFKEAIRYYDQDLSLAKDLQDHRSMGRAYCNLGLAHLALGNIESALDCQKYFLALAHMMKNVQGKFRALGNIGDVLTKQGNQEEAVKIYQKQLVLSKQARDKVLQASAYGSLGHCNRLLKYFDKALGFHTQELTLRQELIDIKGECHAHGHLGAVHMALGNYTNAMKCYEEQLERAKELKDTTMEAQAFGNLGIARLNMGHFEDAIGFFEQQLATLEQLSCKTSELDKGKAFGNLGDCYDALGDFDEASKYQSMYLDIAMKRNSPRDQERGYRSLGNSHKAMGDLQQALVCFEKRLVVSHQLGTSSSKSSAYGDLGQVHSMLGNHDQALSCLEHQLAIASDLSDKVGEGEAASGLGVVYQQMEDYSTALRYHQIDLRIAEDLNSLPMQSRACENISLAYESLGNFEMAIKYGEQLLSVAAQTNDKIAKTAAYSSLGRIQHTVGSTAQAITYLQQGLQISEQLANREQEAKIRHRLGMALWSHGDLEASQIQLDRAAHLFESVRRDVKTPRDYKLSLFDLQTASYEALQRVLITLGRRDEALLVAERGRTRAFVDLLTERRGISSSRASKIKDSIPSSIQQIIDIVNRQNSTVLYFSIAAGYLYSWLIVPNKGLVNFHEVCISEMETEKESECGEEATTTSGSLLMQYIQSVRDALGVECFEGDVGKSGITESENDVGDMWSSHLEELGDRLNHDADRTGFLRMVSRNHLLNSSNYSLSSLFSLGSVTGSVASAPATSRPGSTRSRKVTWRGPTCLRSLYELLIAPVEGHLSNRNVPKDLLLVLQGDLYLVPFPVLKSSEGNEYLCERFSLIVLPSISALKMSQRIKPSKLSNENSTPLVVGNPKLPSTVTEQWGWGDIPYSEQEAKSIAETLSTNALTGPAASKEAVLRHISQAQLVHLATHVSWKLSAVVLSPGEFTDQRSSKSMSHLPSQTTDGHHGEADDDVSSDITSTLDLPALSEFLLTAADILSLKLQAKLVVVSSCHTRDHHGKANSDGVVGLTKALLAAGAQCVLVSLWPVPDTAVKILFKEFYCSLIQGTSAASALSEAQQVVQTTKPFSHPANWAGFLLIGTDVRISNKVALMGRALCQLITSPEKCRDALRVCLHLVEKSLQRIQRGHRNTMYTTQRSIENKVGSSVGWVDLLASVGFRFESPSNGIPTSSVFFPQSDPGGRLSQCSSSLQALLGLSAGSLQALSKLLDSSGCASHVIAVIRAAISQMSSNDLNTESIEVTVPIDVWRANGCHELLASLGFDLMEVRSDEVTLRTAKQASKRSFQFAHQALLALFDSHQSSIPLNSSESSLESLPSSDEEENLPALSKTSPRNSNSTSFTVGPPTFLGRGAFSSYVRNRGEPDGARAPTSEFKGRESDAGFTPSPIDTAAKYGEKYISSSLVENLGSDRGSPRPAPKVSLTLAHQNKIRSKYTLSTSPNSERSGLRPDSSSSTSSMTDWESGQSTVRRQPLHKSTPSSLAKTFNQPSKNTRVSDVSAGLTHPARVVLNRNNNSQASSGFDSQSSDSDLGPKRVGPVRSVYTSLENASLLKYPNSLDSTTRHEDMGINIDESNALRKNANSTRESFGKRSADILSTAQLSSSAAETNMFSSELSNSGTNKNKQYSNRKQPDLKLDSSISTNFQSSQYYNSSSRESTANNYSNWKENRGIASSYSLSINENDSVYNDLYSARDDMTLKIGPKSVQDHIIASQVSRLNRETPISDVYNDRNVGLGLAPPLSKLLLTSQPLTLSEHGGDTESKTGSEDSFGTFDKLSVADEPQLALPPKPDFQPKPPPVPPKRFGPRPWLASTPKLGTVNINIENNEQPTISSEFGAVSDLSRRDEGDGRSMTDSNYSGYSPSRSNGTLKPQKNADISYEVTLPNPPPRALYSSQKLISSVPAGESYKTSALSTNADRTDIYSRSINQPAQKSNQNSAYSSRDLDQSNTAGVLSDYLTRTARASGALTEREVSSNDQIRPKIVSRGSNFPPSVRLKRTKAVNVANSHSNSDTPSSTGGNQ